MPRPNWFLAFPLDGAFVRELPPLPKHFRLFHPDDVHLTLAFLGGSGEEAALRALAELDAALASSPLSALRVSLGKVVPMGGSERTYTALSAVLDDGNDAVRAVLLALRDRLLTAANGRGEARPPKPHVSIARPRRQAQDADRSAGLAWAATLELSAIHARLDRIALYTWHEARHQQLFRVVAERRLDAAP